MARIILWSGILKTECVSFARLVILLLWLSGMRFLIKLCVFFLPIYFLASHNNSKSIQQWKVTQI